MKISRLVSSSARSRPLGSPAAAAATRMCRPTPWPSSTATEIAKSDYEALIAQAKKSYKNQKREFPAAGSQEFQTLRNQAVQFLVQREQFEQKAEDLDVKVTDKQVDARLEQIQKQYFGGDKKKFEKQLKEQGITEAQVRNDIRAQIVSEKIFAQGHGQGEGDRRRDREVLREEQGAVQPAGEPRRAPHPREDEEAGRRLCTRSCRTAPISRALAKKFSEDTGSKANGGKLTISKGQTVAPFDQTAFLLKKNEISKPVKTEFGYHIIQPLSGDEAGEGDAAEGGAGLDQAAAASRRRRTRR